MHTEKTQKRAAVAISGFLFAICLCSLLFLLLPSGKPAAYIADIYQDGNLIMSIPLEDIPVSRSFTVESADGGTNRIEIRSGSIGILSADCPDKLCVKQGFIKDSRLPITCLPNKLVIRLRPAPDSSGEPQDPDIITY